MSDRQTVRVKVLEFYVDSISDVKFSLGDKKFFFRLLVRHFEFSRN